MIRFDQNKFWNLLAPIYLGTKELKKGEEIGTAYIPPNPHKDNNVCVYV